MDDFPRPLRALDQPDRRPWPSRVFRPATDAPVHPFAALPALVVWGLSGWVGLTCGLAESGLRLAWRHLGPGGRDPDLWVNWNAPWLGPLSLAAMGVGLGMIVGLARGVAPRTVGRALPVLLVGFGTGSALAVVPGLASWAVILLAAGLALRLGRPARFESPGFRRFARRCLPWMGGAWLGLLVTTGLVPATAERWHLATAPRARANAPNVLLVVLDTVRADHLAHHGHARATSPRLAARARGGATFTQARSTTPYTLGTHASLFTGRRMTETSARVNVALDATWPTLAEHLRDQGYATGGFVGNIFYGSAHYGLDRGFVHYHDVPGDVLRRVTPREFLRSSRLGEALLAWLERKWRILQPMQRLRLDAGELNREALAWLDRPSVGARPFFLFVNYFDAHSPYSLPAEAPQPFARLTPDRLEALMKRLERLEERTPDDAPPTPEVAALRQEVNGQLRDAYDDGIAWIDRKLDDLLDGLAQRGLLDETLVIVTADHGEMLGEHGLIGHGKTLYRPVVHVPLVVLGGRGQDVPAGAVVDRPVSVRDVASTVLDLIGDPRPDRFPGRSLARSWRPNTSTDQDDPVITELEPMPWLRRSRRAPSASGPIWLLTEGHWSYLRQLHETDGLIERLHDLAADPAEDRDLAADPSYRSTLEALRRRFDAAGG